MLKDSKVMMEEIVKLLDEKKANNISVLNIEDVSLIADYFIICSGNSTTQIKALSDHIEEKLKEQGITYNNKEGYRSATWILLDYGNIVIHIFDKEARGFYDLERLWSDAKVVHIEGILN